MLYKQTIVAVTNWPRHSKCLSWFQSPPTILYPRLAIEKFHIFTNHGCQPFSECHIKKIHTSYVTILTLRLIRTVSWACLFLVNTSSVITKYEEHTLFYKYFHFVIYNRIIKWAAIKYSIICKHYITCLLLTDKIFKI